MGELPINELPRLPGGNSYKESVIKSVKRKKLIRTYYRDGCRAYRLTSTAKELLLSNFPERFAFALTVSNETNHVKSELSHRIRLHRIASVTVTMQNAGVSVYRGEKPNIFTPVWKSNGATINCPVFYNSREIKELGTVSVKINSARSVGVLLTDKEIFVVYNLGSSLLKWSYKSEMRTKALLINILCRERLPKQYNAESVYGLMFSDNMDLAGEILSCSNGKQYFLLDGNYESFHYLTSDRRGERILHLLCHTYIRKRFDAVLLSGLYEKDDSFAVENDAFDENGNPVLLAYTCNLPRIKRFATALNLHDNIGTIICFDFQKNALSSFCGKRIHFQTIDFHKWEVSFFGTS